MEPPLRPPPELIEDAVAEILLRIPPDESAHPVRAAAVCKPWRRILSDCIFRRRYRALHQSPFLLGFLQNLCDDGSKPRFIAAAAAAPCLPIPALDCGSWYALDCRHGRALLRSLGPSGLIVWDPISGGHKMLAVPAYSYHWCTAAVLCAASDGCDHRDCRGSPFTVVFVGTRYGGHVTWACTYSSETDEWSSPTTIQFNLCVVEQRPSLLTEGAVYFILNRGRSILKYNLAGRTLSVIKAPYMYWQPEGIPIVADDGGLGFAGVKDSVLFLWSWYDGADVIAGWVQRRSFKLWALPTSLWFNTISFVEGTDTVVMSTNAGVFTIKLKSGLVRKLGVIGSYYSIVPYLSFYTPGINLR